MSGIYMCGDNGEWGSGADLDCIFDSSMYPNTGLSTYVFCVTTNAQCDCTPGFWTANRDTFSIAGADVTRTTTCDPIECPELVPPSNAFFDGGCISRLYGTQCSMSCASGYYPVGESTYTCGLDTDFCGDTPTAPASIAVSSGSSFGNLNDGDSSSSWSSSTGMPAW